MTVEHKQIEFRTQRRNIQIYRRQPYLRSFRRSQEMAMMGLGDRCRPCSNRALMLLQMHVLNK